MAKAYWIASVTVTDPDKYKGYADLAPVAFKKFGAKYLARGGKHVVLEGDGRARNVVIEYALLFLRNLQKLGFKTSAAQG